MDGNQARMAKGQNQSKTRGLNGETLKEKRSAAAAKKLPIFENAGLVPTIALEKELKEKDLKARLKVEEAN